MTRSFEEGPLTLFPLTYSKTLLTHYQSLSTLDGFILLESADRQRGRYDIVTACPYDTFKIFRDSPNVADAFNQFKDRVPKAPSLCDLPFQGGVIGYVAYDFAEVLLGIRSKSHPLSEMPLMNFGFYDWAIVTDHLLKNVHLVAANMRHDTKDIVQNVLARWNDVPRVSLPFQLKQPFSPLMSQQEYQQGFTSIHDALTQGRAYQVNYTQPFLADYMGAPWEIYQRVRQCNPVPYSAFLRCDEGDILSFSPERFLTIDNGVVQTSPIKGTAKRSDNPIIDDAFKASLLACTKNHAENTMIVDLLRNDFGQFAKPGSVRVTSLCEVQSFNAVHHLVSTIEAFIEDEITPLDAFAACFPGGSITGAPKREAMRIISEEEPYARGVYCGSIAYLSAHGRLDSNIAIRTMTAKKESLYLSAGGGIIMDSTWEDEYRECFTKISAIVNALKF